MKKFLHAILTNFIKIISMWVSIFWQMKNYSELHT